MRRLRRCDSGAAAIEFAIISLVMILVCLAVIEFGRGLQIRNQLSYAADYAARLILLDPEVDNSAVEAVIRERFEGAALEIAPPIAGETGFRTVELSYPFTFLVPGLNNEPMKIRLVRRIPIT